MEVLGWDTWETPHKLSQLLLSQHLQAGVWEFQSPGEDVLPRPLLALLAGFGGTQACVSAGDGTAMSHFPAIRFLAAVILPG